MPSGCFECSTTRGPRWWTFSSSNAPELPALRVEGGELRCRRRLWIQDRGNQPVALIGLGQPGIIELVLDHARLLAVAPGATVLERVDTCHVEAVGQRLVTREPDVGLDPSTAAARRCGRPSGALEAVEVAVSGAQHLGAKRVPELVGRRRLRAAVRPERRVADRVRRAMLDALIGGTTDAQVLADLARGRLRAKLPPYGRCSRAASTPMTHCGSGRTSRTSTFSMSRSIGFRTPSKTRSALFSRG